MVLLLLPCVGLVVSVYNYFMPYYVYILRMLDGRLYVGSSADLNQRYIDHHQNHGSATTSTFGAGELLYYEEQENRVKAEARERQLKKWSQAKKLALAKGDKAGLKRLSKKRSSLK